MTWRGTCIAYAKNVRSSVLVYCARRPLLWIVAVTVFGLAVSVYVAAFSCVLVCSVLGLSPHGCLVAQIVSSVLSGGAFSFSWFRLKRAYVDRADRAASKQFDISAA